MNIFISWSGDRSRIVAEALHAWLPDVIQQVKPWFSANDIPKGSRWLLELLEQLEVSQFGILCITPENMNEPWVSFEAGALAKSLASSSVFPYLLDLDPSDVAGPLAQFQLTRADRDDTRKLLLDINRTFGDARLEERRLEGAFDRCWNELEKGLARARSFAPQSKTERTPEDMMGEILDVARASNQQLARMEARVTYISNQMRLVGRVPPLVQTPFGTVATGSVLSPAESGNDSEPTTEMREAYELARQRAIRRGNAMQEHWNPKEENSDGEKGKS